MFIAVAAAANKVVVIVVADLTGAVDLMHLKKAVFRENLHKGRTLSGGVLQGKERLGRGDLESSATMCCLRIGSVLLVSLNCSPSAAILE